MQFERKVSLFPGVVYGDLRSAAFCADRGRWSSRRSRRRSQSEMVSVGLVSDMELAVAVGIMYVVEGSSNRGR